MLWCLIQDEDCHWYIIPYDMQEQWDKWLQSDDYELGNIPVWAISLNGGPSQVTFDSYVIAE